MLLSASIVLAVFVVGVAVGIFIGSYLEARRWRFNATDYKRIESGGKLYKVRTTPR
jgi:hypothetical protein